jgi:hypothetical protein
MTTLLIAGPLLLSDRQASHDLLSGAGCHAAIAAAPLAATQLWTQAGSGCTAQLLGILERRGIDLAGAQRTGPTARAVAGAPAPTGPWLPEIEPTSAEDVTAVLLIGLAGAELDRALRVVLALPGAEQRMLIIAFAGTPLAAEDCARCASADLVVASAQQAMAVTGAPDALGAGQALQATGVRSTVLSAGMFGGLITYRQKTATYPALPVAAVDDHLALATFAGVLAAWCTGVGKEDFRAIKRGCAMASAVAGLGVQGIGPRKLLTSDRATYMERFNRLRRTVKY